jgi:hypothetical protein
MIKVLYYHYYLFYKKILKDNEPHMLATLVLAFSLSLLIIAIIEVVLANLFNLTLGHYEMLAINLMLIGVLYLTLHRTGKAKEIVNEKPLFFKSPLISKLITFLFFAITSSYLFWGSIYVGNILGTR